MTFRGLPFLELYFCHMTTSLFLVPLEWMRIRLIAQSISSPSEKKFSSLWICCKKLFFSREDEKEGFSLHWKTSFLYHSLYPIIKLFPLIALRLFFPEYASPFVKLLVIASSSFLYYTLSLPLDLLRKRYYLQTYLNIHKSSTLQQPTYPLIPYVTCLYTPSTCRSLYYSNDTWLALKSISQEEGPHKLWSGFTFKMARSFINIISPFLRVQLSAQRE